MTEYPKVHKFLGVEYNGSYYFLFDKCGPEYTIWMKIYKADKVTDTKMYDILEKVYEDSQKTNND